MPCAASNGTGQIPRAGSQLSSGGLQEAGGSGKTDLLGRAISNSKQDSFDFVGVSGSSAPLSALKHPQHSLLAVGLQRRDPFLSRRTTSPTSRARQSPEHINYQVFIYRQRVTQSLTLSGSAHPSLSSCPKVREVNMCSLEGNCNREKCRRGITQACGSGTRCSWQTITRASSRPAAQGKLFLQNSEVPALCCHDVLQLLDGLHLLSDGHLHLLQAVLLNAVQPGLS